MMAGRLALFACFCCLPPIHAQIDQSHISSSLDLAQAYSPIQQSSDAPSDGKWYGSLEFLWWWIRQDDAPALVTTGPAGTSGRLGEPGVEILYGGNIRSRHDRFIGLRPTLGAWLDPCREWRLEASAIILERDSSLFQIEEVTTPLFRPYTDAVSGESSAEQFAGMLASGVVRRGSINIYGRKEFYAEEIKLLKKIDGEEDWRLDGVAGLKFIQFRNRFNIINTGLDEPDLNVLHGVEDNFFAYDRFYGGVLGVRGRCQRGPWSTEATLSCALGGNDQRLVTYGNRLLQTPLLRDWRAGGLYAMPSNATDDSRWVLNAIPEFALTIGWSPTDWLRVQLGYTALLWFNTVRASDQIDTVVNRDQYDGDIEGPSRPGIPWKERMLWLQGLSIGLELSW